MTAGAPRKVRWGVLGAARIATQKVIPAMQRGAASEIVAIASRDAHRARAAAAALAIPTAHASYDDLIGDPDIEAVYIPLPNHLHVTWATRAAEAGKHVLCEKPIGMDADEASRLLAVRDRTGVLIQEAFMIREHPQWTRAIEIVRSGRLGDIQAVVADFSYDNVDPANVRNVAAAGGGGLMDIGCYLIHAARWFFGREPARVACAMEMDPVFGTDRRASMLFDFGDGEQAIATCGTQTVSHQRVQVLGTRGRLEIEIPFNAPPDRACRLFVDDGKDLAGGAIETIEVEVCDQYTRQGDAVSRAIMAGAPAPYPLEDSLPNMRVLDAVREAARLGSWVSIAA